jgi:hypothetical protein
VDGTQDSVRVRPMEDFEFSFWITQYPARLNHIGYKLSWIAGVKWQPNQVNFGILEQSDIKSLSLST